MKGICIYSKCGLIINAMIPIAMLNTESIADQTINAMIDPKLELPESPKSSPPRVQISMIKNMYTTKASLIVFSFSTCFPERRFFLGWNIVFTPMELPSLSKRVCSLMSISSKRLSQDFFLVIFHSHVFLSNVSVAYKLPCAPRDNVGDLSYMH